MLAGVWFIGLYGRWWMAGSVRSQDDKVGFNEPERAGILDMKALEVVSEPVAGTSTSCFSLEGKTVGHP